MEDIATQLKVLEEKVTPYVKDISGDTGFTLDLKSPKVYMYTPGIILILLVIFRPSFLYTSETPVQPKKFSTGRLIVATLVISGMILGGLYAYNYKK